MGEPLRGSIPEMISGRCSNCKDLRRTFPRACSDPGMARGGISLPAAADRVECGELFAGLIPRSTGGQFFHPRRGGGKVIPAPREHHIGGGDGLGFAGRQLADPCRGGGGIAPGPGAREFGDLAREVAGSAGCSVIREIIGIQIPGSIRAGAIPVLPRARLGALLVKLRGASTVRYIPREVRSHG